MRMDGSRIWKEKDIQKRVDGALKKALSYVTLLIISAIVSYFQLSF